MAIFSDLPFDRAGGHGGDRSQTQMVVIHATDNTASAAAEAHYAETRPDLTSAHFYSDETEVIQALDTDLVAYGCYPIGNSRSVQFEIAGRSNELTDASLRLVAPVVARVCALYGLPVGKLSPADLLTGAKGICGHGDVTAAWHQGDHTDPGASFPWSTFIGYVQDAAKPQEEDAMSNAVYQVPPVFVLDHDGNSLGSQLKQCVLSIPVDNPGGQDISVGCDFGAARLRVAYRADGQGWNVKYVDVDSTMGRVHLLGNDEIPKPKGGLVMIARCMTGPTDTDPYTPVGVVVNTH